MEVHAKTFTELGLVPVGIRLQWNQQASRKKIEFKPMWQRAKLGTYKDYFNNEDNGIALVTGEPSDLIVVDCDVQKDSDRDNGIQDGMALFGALVEQHGLPENTPIQRSASGSLHYFFSLSKSIEGGLQKASSTTKLRIDNSPSSIDTRADGGCIIVSPSQVNSQQYVFMQPLVWRKNHAVKKDSLSRLCSQMSTLSLETSTEHRITVLMNDAESTVESVLQINIERKWVRTGGFDFKPRSIVKCTLCGNEHQSNNYLVRQIIENCFFINNYSKSCSSNAFNWDKHESLRMVLETPSADKPYALMFNASLRSRGFLLVNAYNTKTKQGRLVAFNGIVWQELSAPRVLNDISDTSGTILENLLRYVRPPRDAPKSQIRTIKEQRQQFAIRTPTSCQSATASSTYKRDFYETVLHQTTCPVNWMSRQLDVLYNGLEAKTDVINEFIGGLFNYDEDSIAYLQRLLGYGITGHMDSQVWCMFTGGGSNGKSLLASLLEDLLESWVVTAPYEIFFRGDQRAREGSHSTHLGTLRGARICIKEEAEPKDRLSTEILKTVTGGGSITMRGAYSREFETFKPMCLPILVCNHRPEVDVTDEAMMRRIVVVPFHNVYTTPDDPKRPYNVDNPNYRLRDPELKHKLLKENAREQFLVWLVQGAVAWYENKDLSKQPPAMLRAFQEDNDENDKLQLFQQSL
ncbi:hypothetical protein EDD21DRAFT_429505 [Dissophora ornata]|nr:hypothetical protein BGZ58_001991 [Dissophora ornata]KAI8601329.1 hypothetical protein EDD21DRAFT_429505 [Dissophora ornata]